MGERCCRSRWKGWSHSYRCCLEQCLPRYAPPSTWPFMFPKFCIGFFIPDYTAYNEMLSLFRNVGHHSLTLAHEILVQFCLLLFLWKYISCKTVFFLKCCSPTTVRSNTIASFRRRWLPHPSGENRGRDLSRNLRDLDLQSSQPYRSSSEEPRVSPYSRHCTR